MSHRLLDCSPSNPTALQKQAGRHPMRKCDQNPNTECIQMVNAAIDITGIAENGII